MPSALVPSAGLALMGVGAPLPRVPQKSSLSVPSLPCPHLLTGVSRGGRELALSAQLQWVRGAGALSARRPLARREPPVGSSHRLPACSPRGPSSPLHGSWT